MGIIYLIKNNQNNKIYIGQTTKDLNKRWGAHISSFKRFKNGSKHGCSWALYGAFKKYGINNFSVFLLKKCPDNSLDDIESFYIRVFNSMVPFGYNIRSGGKTGKHCKESREKMRQSKLGSKNHNYGKPRSEDFKRKLSIAKSGENHHFYGKKFQCDHIENLSKSHKKGGPSEGLPMYMVYVKPRPEHYCYEGYAIVNHPMADNKYFTSKKLSMEEKFDLAKNYLDQIKEKGSTTGRKSV